MEISTLELVLIILSTVLLTAIFTSIAIALILLRINLGPRNADPGIPDREQ